MDNCPNCKVSFIGDPIPDNINHHYHGKYWRREIVINVRGIYDGAVAIRCPDCGHEFPRNNSSLAMSKPREFWINETLGTASESEDSIENGYTTHAIEHSAYRQLKNKLDVYEDKVYHLSRRVEELEYLLKVANDREA